MAQLISQSHALCIQTFQQLCKAAADSERCPESFQLALLDELDKYRIWSGNLGASHAGRTYKLSLDYRLREATFYKDQVVSIVDTLQRHVEDARQIVCGERKPFEDFSESDSDEEPDLSPSNDTPYGKGHDSPWESSSESGSMPNCEPSNVGPKAFDETPGLLPQATELAQLLEAIKLTIRSLYKLPIRKPAPVDRLKGNLTDEVSCFQPFDCIYVRDKFPRLSREVADRIGSHITRRRQLLLYRQEHQDFLRQKEFQNDPRPALASTGFQIETKQHLLKKGDDASSAQFYHAPASQLESKPQTLRSKATTFVRDEEQPFQLDFLSAPSVAGSISQTSIAASQATQETPVEVPPRPKDLKGTSKAMFECKYCALTTYIESDRAWKRHVLSDLQPYVCTFPECDFGDHMFVNRDTWFQHEMQMHRVEYFCNAEAHPVHRNLSDFKDHMQQEHGISLRDVDGSAAMNMFRRPVSPSEGICNLCFREQSVKNMKSHVSKHLEQVALFAIPRAEYGEDDVEAGEVQSRQAQYNLDKSIPQNDESEDFHTWEENPLEENPLEENPLEETPLEEDPAERTPIPDAPNVDWQSVLARSRVYTHASQVNEEMVVCDTCKHEWRRVTHSLICPNCASGFTERMEDPSGSRESLFQQGYPEIFKQIYNYPYRSILSEQGGIEASSLADVGSYQMAPRPPGLPDVLSLGAIITNPWIPTLRLSLPTFPPDTRTKTHDGLVIYYPEDALRLGPEWRQFLRDIIHTARGDLTNSLTGYFAMDTLETVSLREDPTVEEVSARVSNEPKIQKALGAENGRQPVYMITGLKIAKGLRLSRESFQKLAFPGDVQEDRRVRDWLNRGTDSIFAYQLHVITNKGPWEKITVELYRPKSAIL